MNTNPRNSCPPVSSPEMEERFTFGNATEEDQLVVRNSYDSEEIRLSYGTIDLEKDTKRF